MMTTIMTAVKDDDEVGFNVPHGRELEGLPYAKEKGSRKEFVCLFVCLFYST